MIEVTPEIRQAVMDAECERIGHDIAAYQAILWSDDRQRQVGVGSNSDSERLASMSCLRCGRTWVILPVEGGNYEEAEGRVYAELRPDQRLAKRILRQRARRAERDRPKVDLVNHKRDKTGSDG